MDRGFLSQTDRSRLSRYPEELTSDDIARFFTLSSREYGPEVRDALLARFDGEAGERLRFFDVGNLLTATATPLSRWNQLFAAKLGSQTGLYGSVIAAATLEGFWRHVPFWNSPEWAKHVHRFGLPLVLRDTIRVPSEKGIKFQRTGGEAVAGLAHLLGVALGLPIEVSKDAYLGTILKGVLPAALSYRLPCLIRRGHVSRSGPRRAPLA